MPIELPLVEPVTPLYFLGDSNTLIYRNLSLEMPAYFPRRIVTSSCFVPALSAANILEGDALNSQILQYFRAEMVIEYNERWIRFERNRRAIEQRTWAASVHPPLQDIFSLDGTLALVLMVGTLDLGKLVREIGPNVDFVLKDPRYVDEAFSGPDLPLVPLGAMVDLVKRRLAPIGRALTLLREIGFTEFYLHNLHPPTVDDVIYYRIREVISSAKIRYKMAVLINRELERLAHESGIWFLDMWDETVTAGIVDPKFNFDGDHLNRAAADLTIRAVLNDTFARRGVPISGTR